MIEGKGRAVSLDQAELTACLATLARLAEPDLAAADRQRLERAVTEAARGIKRRAKARRTAATKAADRALLASATRAHTERPDPAPATSPPTALTPAPAPSTTTPPTALTPAPAPSTTTPPAALTPVTGGSIGMLRRERRCYVCKALYREVDADYHQMCATCADHNRAHRTATADLTGRTAIVTGGRVKIGFHTVLRLLRCGATVLVTTRFPRDAARRFAGVPDFAEWADRLVVHGLDLLDLPATLEFVAAAGRRFAGLDILINNAAQTLHRPEAYHREVRAAEAAPLQGPAARLAVSADSPPTAALAVPDLLFPAGQTDETGEQLDLRAVNSWVLRDTDVSPREWLQVQVVNAFAPFLLTSRLRPLLAASPRRWRHVVQVSAMEGSFSRRTKTIRHPHTNMAKASLNMLVRTVAADYAGDGILMNAVDTGWVTDERPHPSKQAQRAGGFRPPLDVIDGAARVCHPIIAAEHGEPISGQFLKDYRSVPW
jgi:NAD(P)-dependent dehydrogenase (short-subunit alcohol dehydrogenase family)